MQSPRIKKSLFPVSGSNPRLVQVLNHTVSLVNYTRDKEFTRVVKYKVNLERTQNKVSLISMVLIISTIMVFNSCTSSDKRESKMAVSSEYIDSTVFEKRDSMGRVIERWGNYHTTDMNQNFRHFYFYNSEGLLSNEKQYWFDEDNKECIIRDTAEYEDIYYQYKIQNKEYILEKETSYGRNYDTNGKFIGRKLYYIHDVINDKFIYRDDSSGDSTKIEQRN